MNNNDINKIMLEMAINKEFQGADFRIFTLKYVNNLPNSVIKNMVGFNSVQISRSNKKIKNLMEKLNIKA